VAKSGLETAEKGKGAEKRGRQRRETTIKGGKTGREIACEWKEGGEREREEREREELERVMIVTTVVRTNEHLGTAFGIFQVSSNAQRRIALCCGNARFDIYA